MSAAVSNRSWCVVGLALCLFCIGCGGPYYTMSGGMQAKTLIVHDGKNEIKVDLATSMGGGLAGDKVNLDGTFKVEKDGVVVTGKVDPTGRVAVGDVTFKGKQVGQGSMTEL